MINRIIYHNARTLSVLALLIGALVFFGCSGTPEATTPPTENIPDPVVTADPNQIGDSGEEPTRETGSVVQVPPTPNITQPPFPTMEPTIEGALIAVDSRTLVASRTEDPNAGEPFDLLRIERSGGPGSSQTTPPPPLVIELQGDGTMTYGDQQAQVPQAVLDQMNNRIRAIDFFGISGDFLGSIGLDGTEDYIYQVYITRGNTSRRLSARDTVMPQELRDFIAYLMLETQKAANS